MRKAVLVIAAAISITTATPVMACSECAPHAYTEIFNNATAEDYRALEQVIYWEGAITKGIPMEMHRAVVETVCDRVLSTEFPNTIREVCTQKGQFVCKPFKADAATMETISDAIESTIHEGPTVLPRNSFVCFATKKQSMAKNHIWIGAVNKDGKPKKGFGMYFGELK